MDLKLIEKFTDPLATLEGKERAAVEVTQLTTLWFNTGTLCNLSCSHCYIESTPKNDRLVHLTTAEVVSFLDEIERDGLPTEEIGLTGGEPFMNPDILPIMEASLARGFRLLILTNAMRPMMKCADGLLGLQRQYPGKLTLRVSVDHYQASEHEKERGAYTWQPMIEGLRWLCNHGFSIDVAGRTFSEDSEDDLRRGFGRLFDQEGINIDSTDQKSLLLFQRWMKRLWCRKSQLNVGVFSVSRLMISCAPPRGWW